MQDLREMGAPLYGDRRNSKENPVLYTAGSRARSLLEAPSGSHKSQITTV